MYQFDSDKHDTFGVPIQVLSLSNMSHSKRKDLIHCLRRELEQIQMLQKKVELLRTNGVTVSSSSDILSCRNGQNLPRVKDVQKLPIVASGPGKKGNPRSGKACQWIRGSSGKFKSSKHASEANTANIFLMKQCEGLLKRLMGHQYRWVFNEPVDVVKLNIPDYFNVIKHPMDLGTVKKKIDSGGYASPLEFYADVRLTFCNAMTYNPPGNNVHVMADTLNKFFEVRWKNIEKKLRAVGTQLIQSKAPAQDVETSKTILPAKKRKMTSVAQQVIPEPVKRMTDEEKHKLGVELESLLTEMPMRIIDFLREHSSNGRESEEEEIEIDIDGLCDDTLFTLRKLLDDHLQEKHNNKSRAEPCEIQLMNKSGPSSSPRQQGRGDDRANEAVDARGNEPPVSSYPPKKMEKDTGLRSIKSFSSGISRDLDSGSFSDSEACATKASSPVGALKVLEAVDSGTQLDEKTSVDNLLDRNQCVRFDQLEQTSHAKSSSIESDCHQDGDSAPIERQVSPEKLYRAALLKNRFADTILKAREKTLTTQGEKGDPEKLHREREELEHQRKKEKARLLAEAKAAEDAQRRAEAEAKAAEDAQRRAEAEAAAEARRKREIERDAARQALLKMEKTVEINENSRFLEDLEMLRAAPAEHLPSSVDETSPEHSHDGLGSFKFGSSNPLELLGLYMKEDEEEEEGEPPNVPNPINDPEEGEID